MRSRLRGASTLAGTLTTTLTAKGAYTSAKNGLWRTDYRTGLLGLDSGGLYSVELENQQG